MNLLDMFCNQEEGAGVLPRDTQQQLLADLPDWSVQGIVLVKAFNFTKFHEVIAFVNAIAWIAHQEDHHPDLSVHYNRVIVNFSTHSANGLTLNDFICAAKTQALLNHP
ncbi:4a-hydroxytetrahydrobiopterin dehydratase [Neisseriaceae bacterium TC5R-5]|nr:4a-hydroxytetrahydrobiopterin dehydratase [Neisseriaceae bacterium TC5R-5]